MVNLTPTQMVIEWFESEQGMPLIKKLSGKIEVCNHPQAKRVDDALKLAISTEIFPGLKKDAEEAILQSGLDTIVDDSYAVGVTFNSLQARFRQKNVPQP